MSRIFKTSFFMIAFASFAVSNTLTAETSTSGTPKTTTESDRIVAKINDKDIIRNSDIDKAMKEFPQQGMENLSPEKKTKIRSLILSQLVANKIMANAAKKAGIERDEQYKSILKEQKNALMVRVFMDKAIKARLTPQTISAKAQELQKAMENQLERKVCMIITENDEVAKQALADLNAGKDFIETAKKYSNFPTEEGKINAAKGVSLVVENTPLFTKQMKDAILALKVNEYTKEPIALGGKKVIIKVTETKKVTPTEKEIAMTAMQTIAQEATKALLDTEKAKNKIVYYNEDGVEVPAENISIEDLLN